MPPAPMHIVLLALPDWLPVKDLDGSKLIIM